MSQHDARGQRGLRARSRASTRRRRRRSTTRSPDLASQGGARARASTCATARAARSTTPSRRSGELVPAGSTVVTLKKRGTVEPIVPKTTPVLRRRADRRAGRPRHGVERGAASPRRSQELRHATVVGSRTKGKWTVQKLDDLPNGYAIKYTMALFTSPVGQELRGHRADARRRGRPGRRRGRARADGDRPRQAAGRRHASCAPPSRCWPTRADAKLLRPL